MTNILRKDERVKLPAIFFLALFVPLFFSSCQKEESDLGLGVQPEQDLLNALVIDTFTIHTFSSPEDSLKTDELSSVMIGNYSHNDFGQFNASFFTQLNISSTSGFSSPVVDSVVVQLVYSGVYGEPTEQQFEVYEVTDDMYLDSTYYSNSNINFNPSNLAPAGSNYFEPNTSDSITVNGTKIKPHLRLHLTTAFGQYLLGFAGACMTNFDEFNNCFKGLYFKSSSILGGNSGATYNISLTDAQSKLIVYYHDATDTTQYDFPFGTSVARFTRFETNYTGSPVDAQLTDTTLGDKFYYLQAGASLGADLNIPYITDLNNLGNIVINRAELVLPAQYYTTDQFAPSFRIFVFPYNADGTYGLTLDQIVDPSLTTYGGIYDNTKKGYVFNISRHIQRILKGQETNHGFRIAVGGSSVTANATILNGSNSPNRDKPYLKITYTKYQ